jgi:hypothetical protein
MAGTASAKRAQPCDAKTKLAPEIVETILDSHQTKRPALANFMAPFLAEWEEQRRRLGF